MITFIPCACACPEDGDGVFVIEDRDCRSWSHLSLFDYLATSNDGIVRLPFEKGHQYQHVFPDSEPQETRTQVRSPAAMGRQGLSVSGFNVPINVKPHYPP